MKVFEPFHRNKNVDHTFYDTNADALRKKKCDLTTLTPSNLHVQAFNKDPKYSTDYDHKVPHLIIPNLIFVPQDDEKNQLCTPHERNMISLDPWKFGPPGVGANRPDLRALFGYEEEDEEEEL